MKTHLAFTLALAGFVTLVSPRAFAKSNPDAAETVPQIVRITYLEGDVRISRGTEGGAPKNVDWEKAVADLPLQAGFTLATDNGRAEIEFEDSSTLYMAPNSVLLFNALDSTADIPHTDLALLSGTVSLAVIPSVKGDTFILRTPTDTMITTYGQHSDLRVTAYMDAIAITPLKTGFLRTSKDTMQIVRPGHTDYFRSGKQIDYADPNAETAFADWDKWVAARTTERNQAIGAMLRQTGLSQPVPGLAQMAGQGKWVDCAGYGKCWQPPSPTASPLKAASLKTKPAPSLLPSRSAYSLTGEPAPPPATSPNLQSAYSPGPFGISPYGVGPYSLSIYGVGPYGVGMMDADSFFPCDPTAMFYNFALMQTIGLDYGLGMNFGLGLNFGSGINYTLGMNGPMGSMAGLGMMSSWDWAVCHSGSWLYRQNQYMWVPGQTIHHQPPVRWIRTGGKVGWVPIHPGDAAGKPPLNAQNGVFTVNKKNGLSLQRTALNSAEGVKLLDEAPKEFRKTNSPVLVRTDAPRMEAHMISPALQNAGPATPGGNKPGAARISTSNPASLRAGIDNKGGPAAGIPILFDHRSQSFMISHQVVEGGSIRTVNEPVGSYLARSGAPFGGHEGFESNRGAYSNGGSAAGAYSASRSSGYSASRGGGNFGGNQAGNASQSSAGASRGGGSFGGGASEGGGSAPSGGGSAPSSGGHR